MSACEVIVAMLEGVRSRGPLQWSARCPAHDDRGPSLSIKGLPDGRVLLHCFAGCGVEDVLGAMGMDMQALFPPNKGPNSGHSRPARIGLLSRGQALDLLQSEALFVAVAACNVGHGMDLSPSDKARLITASGRITYLRGEAMA